MTAASAGIALLAAFRDARHRVDVFLALDRDARHGFDYATNPLAPELVERLRPVASWPSRATNVFPNVIPESTPVAGGWPGAWASTSTYAWTYAWTRSWTDTDAAPTARPAPGPTPSDGWPDSRLGSLPERLAIPRATRSSRAFEPRL